MVAWYKLDKKYQTIVNELYVPSHSDLYKGMLQDTIEINVCLSEKLDYLLDPYMVYSTG